MLNTPAPVLPTRLALESWFDKHMDALITLLKQHTALYRPSTKAKPWWSTLLSTLRRKFHTASCKARSSRDTQDIVAARLSKGGYFKAIKAAKAAHWKSFLADATPRSIWTARKFAMGRPVPRFPNLPDAGSPTQINKILLGHFFPP